MAEAAVDPARFFCHGCNRHFVQSSTDLVCPHCDSGFVEEVEHDTSLDTSLSSDVDVENYHNGEATALEMLGGSLLHYVPGAAAPNGPGYESELDPISFFSINIQPHLESSTGASNSTEQPGAATGASFSSDSRAFTDALPQTGRFAFRIRDRRTPDAGGPGGASNVGQQDPMSQNFILEGFLQQLLTGSDPGAMLGGGGAGGATLFNTTGPGSSPLGMFSLHGNPADYAWGTNGLDDIITRLLGQLENSGAPPATQTAIQRLQTVTITKEHVEASKDCSVCMEGFVVDDRVRKLPCEHMFHIKCIDQWLKLHNTCPICRTNIETTDAASCPRSTNRNAHSTSGPSTSGV